MLPDAWDAVVALPLAVLYCVAIGRRMMRLTSIFQSENYSIRPYFYRLVHLRDEGYYTIGNLISVGLLVGFWAVSFTVHDPYGYSAIAFLLIGLAANWLIVILSLLL